MRAFLPALFVGGVLRLVLILVSPEDGMKGGDFTVYHSTANHLANSASAWIAGGEFGWRPPLYFVYLATIYLPFPGNAPYWVGQLATSVLFVPISLALAKIGERLGLPPHAVGILVWIRSILPVFVITDVFVLSEPMFALLFLAFALVALELTRQPTSWTRQSLFSLLGVAMILTREVGAIFFLAGLVSLAPVFAKVGAKSLTQFGAVLVVVGALALSPWLYRNELTYGRAFPISSTAGFNLHVGNHPDANGGYSEPTASGHVPPDDLKFGTPEWSAWHQQRAIAYIRENPDRFVKLIPYRLGYLFFPHALRDEIMTLDVFPRIPHSVQYLLVALATASSAALILCIPLSFCCVPAGVFRNTALLATLGLIAAVAATQGVARYLDAPMHAVLLGVAPLVANPRIAGSLMRGKFAWAIAVTWIGIGYLWTQILQTKV